MVQQTNECLDTPTNSLTTDEQYSYTKIKRRKQRQRSSIHHQQLKTKPSSMGPNILRNNKTLFISRPHHIIRIGNLFHMITVLAFLSQLFLVVRTQVFDDEHHHHGMGSPFYDPESDDGIPVIRTKAADKHDSSALSHHIDRLHDDDMNDHGQVKRANRRSIDDDDMDDDPDDRDEDQSSSNRVSDLAYDPHNPPFEESTKAAQEREDIERFFDDHLGPSEEMAPSVLSRASASPDDLDDMDIAASSPLSVLSNMLFGRVRPTIITTSSSPITATSLSSLSSPLSTSASSAMWTGGGSPSPYDDSPSHLSYTSSASTSDGPSYHNPMTSSSSSYYNDDMGPTRDTVSIASGYNRGPSHYSRYPYGGASMDTDYTGPYDNPSLAQASETGAGQPYPPRRPHHQSSSHPQHYSLSGSSTSLYRGQSSGSSPNQGLYSQTSSEYSSSNRLYGPQHTGDQLDDNYNGRANQQMRHAPSRPTQYAHDSGYQQQQNQRPSSYSSSGPRSNTKYYHQQQGDYTDQPSSYRNGNNFMIPNDIRGNLSPYADATTNSQSGDRGIVESLLDYPTHSGPYNNNNKRQRQNFNIDEATYSTMILRGAKQYHDRSPLERGPMDGFNINRDDLPYGVPPLSVSSRHHHADQPQATASQPTISNNQGDNSQGEKVELDRHQQQQQSNETLIVHNQNNSNSNNNNNNNNLHNIAQGKQTNSGTVSGVMPPSNQGNHSKQTNGNGNKIKTSARVRRDDNEADGDNDDDAQWIDDEDNLDDDDNKQQSSNVDEQSQEPYSDNGAGDNGETLSRHGYELSPDDLIVYGQTR